MTYLHAGAGALDYLSCGYGQDRLHFRGPERAVDKPYGVFIGGTETYGKFVARPFPALVEDLTGVTSINLGVVNAGVETFRSDPTVLNIARGAEYVVLQATGPQYVSNAFYAVHPRRNDRFIRARPALETLFPQVELTDVHFVGHLLRKLRRASPKGFEKVAQECRRAWLTSLIGTIRRIGRPTLTLWLPPRDAMLSDRMLDPLRRRCLALVQVAPGEGQRFRTTDGMVFGPLDSFAASDLPNPLMHEMIAGKLHQALLAQGLA
ncbi:DUF6473 family protein [Thalassovita sp.]|uniref:DUF6473 family protein n=1 Tax=Thalassovita sp. TaxID=1979401 RepID=UPI0029DE6E66|nr:DUF6473 family protein [Thalassovita sp.]